MPDLLVEIGCEELPASACREAEEQLPGLLQRGLEAAGLNAQRTAVHVAPRRLAALAFGVPAERTAERREVRGPRADAPARASEGFARRHGIDPADLERRGGMLWAVLPGASTPAAELVPELVTGLVGGLQFGKTMRWDGGRFSRPIRWLVVKLDEHVIRVEAAGVVSGETSFGHRFLGGPTRVRSAGTYLEDLRGVRVVADAAERRQLIEDGLSAAGEWIDPMGKVAEVVQLVEWPEVLEGRFDERYLVLPLRLPITAMQAHQRYFPVASEDGGLEPRFLFVANGAARRDIVVAGNEGVLVGRLEDAAFAYEKDLARGIEAMAAELGRVRFLEGSGSLADKAARVRALAEQLSDRTGAAEAVKLAVLRGAELCKADLVSALVAEFSDLQGYAGGVYARQSGEPADVCDAIEEHHQPVEAGGALPSTPAGALLAVADKVDTVAVGFALGLQPTGSRDPYGLRRAAAGIVAITLQREFELGLAELVGLSVQELVAQGRELRRRPLEVVPEAVGFILDRAEPVLLSEGVTIEEIRAARGAGHGAPLPLALLARALRDARGSAALAAVRDAYGRSTRITAKAAGDMAPAFDPSLLREEAERELHAALRVTDEGLADCVARRDFDAAIAIAHDLVPAIDRFFVDVLVMDPDRELRGNRLKLLFNVAAALRSIGDLDQLPGS
jgi:tetrameric-type glycyl-tRNA synthetase beta subunit